MNAGPSYSVGNEHVRAYGKMVMAKFFWCRICLACLNVPGHLTCHSPLSSNSSRDCNFLGNALRFCAFSSTSHKGLNLGVNRCILFKCLPFHTHALSSSRWNNTQLFMGKHLNHNLLFLPFHFLVFLKDTLRSIDNVSEYHAMQSECLCLEVGRAGFNCWMSTGCQPLRSTEVEFCISHLQDGSRRDKLELRCSDSLVVQVISDDFTIANCNGTLGTWLVVFLRLQERVQTKVSPSIKSNSHPKMEDLFKSFSKEEWS